MFLSYSGLYSAHFFNSVLLPHNLELKWIILRNASFCLHVMPTPSHWDFCPFLKENLLQLLQLR